MSSLASLDGMLFMHVDYDASPLDSRTGSLLLLADFENGAVVEVTSKRHSKEAIAGLYQELERLHAEGNLKVETAKPYFNQYLQRLGSE
jgi:hypothetical protein